MSEAQRVINAQSALWEQCFASKKWKKLSELYSEDCKVYPPGCPIAVGRTECAAAWKSLGDMGVDKIELDNVETEYDGGDMAADRSTFKMYDTEGKQIDNGEYVVIWRRVPDHRNPVRGNWYLHYDIFNSTNPSVKTPHTFVVEQSNKWEHFYATGDFDSLSALYTPDCKVFLPGRIIAEGRIACARAWSRLRESGARYIKLKCEETIEMGEGMVSDYSTYRITDSRGKQIDHGKYVAIWKRLEDRQWYLHFDAFNSDVN